MEKTISLHDYLNQEGFDVELIQALIPLFHFRHYQKGEILLAQGENTKVVSLILQGTVRGFYLDATGADITKCFSQAGDWCCIYNLLDDGPSEYGIETLADCQVAQVGVATLRQALDDAPVLRDLYEKLFRQAFVLSDKRAWPSSDCQPKNAILNLSPAILIWPHGSGRNTSPPTLASPRVL